jgi:quercetin dioxygenase-like cupin family protein
MTSFENGRATEIRQAMRGGPGQIEVAQLFSTEESNGKLRLCARLTVQPGCGIGEHAHAPDAELVYILSGELTVNDNGTTRVLHAGDATFTGDGAVHSLVNRSNAPVQILAVVMN